VINVAKILFEKIKIASYVIIVNKLDDYVQLFCFWHSERMWPMDGQTDRLQTTLR